METYAGNHSGDYTGMQGTDFTTGIYKISNFNDPSNGTPYTVTSQATAADPATCTTPNVYFNVTGRTVTTFMCLEQGFQKLTNN
jgi:hypothetical protein